MGKKNLVTELLLGQKLLPLYYHESAEVSVDILKALYSGGIRVVEYTNRGENALKNFVALKKAAKKLPGILIGIGTIKNKQQAKQYIKAGADFIVCPSMNEEVAKVTHDAGLLWIPGCMTPTEIAAAENSGATIVKLFPGNILGTSFLAAVKDLFPALLFMPTGGVELDKENIAGWFKAGVCAVGMGSRLISKELLEHKEYAKIEELTKQAMEIVKWVK